MTSKPAIPSVAVAFLICGMMSAGAATLDLQPVSFDDPYQRWRDIATTLYSSAQRTAYTYAQAAVTVDTVDSEEILTGTVTASGLKPNCAYQLKLNGKPSLWYVTAGDNWSNEQIGYAGRWWMKQVDKGTNNVVSERNSTDAEYESYRDSPTPFTDETYDYVFFGYLLYGYVVTDAAGAVSDTFVLDSSYHVLFKTTQATARPGIDSVPTTHTVVASRKSAWYDRNYRATNVGIFAEWQSDRPLPGDLRLPSGDYNVALYLTEESFHETAPYSGSWATVMSAEDFSFTISASVPPDDYDAAVTGVTAPESVLLGDTVTVTVAVANEGLLQATMSVTLHDETSGQEVGTDNITLLPGTAGECEIAWNTAGTTEGDHQLRAEIAALSGETDLTDNQGWTSVNVYDPGAVPVVTVSNLAVQVGTAGKNTFAVADVTVTDAATGLPVEAATVTVRWELDSVSLGDSSALTDLAGVASPQSAKKKSIPSGSVFRATVIDVTKTGCTYDGGQPSGTAAVP